MPPSHGGRPLPPPPPPHYAPVRPAPPPMHMGRPLAPGAPVYVDAAPPRMRYEVRPPRPSPGHIWIDGYWGWDNGAHVWIGGEWSTPPQPGYAWVTPRWRRHGHRWVYAPGYWNHHHGPMYVGADVPGPAYGGGGITISGRVMSMQGAPVPGIMVTLAGTQEGQIVTDGSGSYVFGGLPPGSYAIRPSGPCAFAPDVANLNNLYGSVTQDIIVSGCGGW